MSEHLDRRVDELELSVRSSNVLQNLGITTISDLVRLTEADFLKARNSGRKSLLEIKEVLGDLGLRLGMLPSSRRGAPDGDDSGNDDGGVL